MTSERNDLQNLLLNKFYKHPRVLRITNKAKRIITDLFNVYKEDPKQIPEGISSRNQGLKNNSSDQYICNCIASMTDRFAIDEHKKLFDPYEKV